MGDECIAIQRGGNTYKSSMANIPLTFSQFNAKDKVPGSSYENLASKKGVTSAKSSKANIPLAFSQFSAQDKVSDSLSNIATIVDVSTINDCKTPLHS